MLKHICLVFLATSLMLAQQPPKGKRSARISCPPVGPVKVLKMVKPVYPKEAKSRAIFGSVTVELVIDKHGSAKNIRVLKGDPVLAESVLVVLPRWRWKPYKLNGEAVEVESTLTVNFEPR